MNILFLSSWYPSRTNTTLGNFVQRHAESVAKKNQVTTLYISKTSDLKASYEISDEMIRGVRTVIVYFKKSPFDKLNAPRYFKKGIKYLRENDLFKFDLVHLNVILNSGWQAIYLKNKFNLPYVITEHWTGFHNNPGKQIVRWKKKMALRISEKSSSISPVSEHLGQAMNNFGLKGNYSVVYNVVDTELFKINDNKPSNFRLIHVSHLGDDHKNITGLIYAFRNALKSNPQLELHIVGDGDIEPYLKLRKDLFIPENSLVIKGKQTLDKIAEFIAESHVFVLFSNYENLPCVIVEAFACGIPVISTDVGGIKEILNSDRGILIEQKDEEALTSSMLDISKEYTKFIPLEIRDYAIKNFGIESISKKYAEIYRSVIK